MTTIIAPIIGSLELPNADGREVELPKLINDSDADVIKRYVEFFFVHIRNRRTRRAYRNGITPFLEWCEVRGISLVAITPLVIAAYIESHQGAAPTVNQHLAAIKQLFSWLQADGLIERNPAEEVRGVKHRVKVGKTPVLSDDEVKKLLSAIDISHVVGLCDRALIAAMFFSFARIEAVLAMHVKDYFPKSKAVFAEAP